MRLNKYIAASTDLSRRGADAAIAAGRVTVDGAPAQNGTEVGEASQVKLDGHVVTPRSEKITIMFNKPVGYVCSRDGQGRRTIYELLPPEYQHLNSVGRLDKNSSGLLLLTNDGELANQLTHPRYQKTKVYEVTLDRALQPLHHQLICDRGIMLEDGLSKFEIIQIERGNTEYQITMSEGRNRQIRRTFEALGYRVKTLHRTHFGRYGLSDLKQSTCKIIPT